MPYPFCIGNLCGLDGDGIFEWIEAERRSLPIRHGSVEEIELAGAASDGPEGSGT